MKFLKKLNSEDTKLDLKDNIKFYILIFLTSGVIGYIYEVLYFLIAEGKFINRGFLYGPFLPVYGWGALAMALLLKKFKKNPVVLFIMAMLVTGILEYFSGYFMYLIWHKRWWDYTGLFLNINGFVCLRSVIAFGIGGLLLFYLFEPLLKRFITCSKPVIINIIIIFSLILYFFDNIFSYIFRNPV